MKKGYNDRITKKEISLIKGALRRVFSRSELRKEALKKSHIEHVDSTRPRVKKWSLCPLCHNKIPAYMMVVDHIQPIIAIEDSFESMDLIEVVNNMWCDPSNLQAICKPCHKQKTNQESKQRRAHKKLSKKLTDE